MKNNKKVIYLPSFLKPNFKTDLVRLGKKNDGGYCVSQSSLKDTSILFSFGLSDDWSFEKQFREKSGAKIVCFDPNVTLMFWIKRFIKDFIQFISLKETNIETIKRFFTFFYYKIFFNSSEKIHLKKFFGSTNHLKQDSNNFEIIDLPTIFKKWDNQTSFIKIDIEGSEYRVLDQIIEHQEKLKGLVIEFHDCDLMFEKIKFFIEKFDLNLVHIHVNNFGIITKTGFPSVIELTFSPKRYNSRREEKENNFPLPFLDQPNNKNLEDLHISFY